MFSSRNSMVSDLTLKSLIHFQLILQWSKIAVQFHSFHLNTLFLFFQDYLLFIKQDYLKDDLFYLNIFGSLVKYQLIIYVWAYFVACDSVPLVHVPVFMPIPYGCDHYSLQYCLKSEMLCLQVALAFRSQFQFYIHFKVAFFFSNFILFLNFTYLYQFCQISK